MERVSLEIASRRFVAGIESDGTVRIDLTRAGGGFGGSDHAGENLVGVGTIGQAAGSVGVLELVEHLFGDLKDT